jgi:hypothetical protein
MKVIKREEIGEVLFQIYKSELDFRLESSWDTGYYFSLGTRYDNYGSFFAPASQDLEDVITELGFRLTEKYPKSDFAKYWQGKIKSLNINVADLTLAPAFDWDAKPTYYQK